MADNPMRCAGVAVRRLEPFERQREVRAAFGRDERMDLVDDHGVDRAQRLPRVRGEQQVERLGRRDQDVGRLTLEPRALARRACRPSEWPPPERETARCGQPPDWRCRQSATAGCARRRPPAPSAATRRGCDIRLRRSAASARQVGSRLPLRGDGRNIIRLIAHRKAARVLPLPVGARISVDSPRAMAGHPCACGGVGVGNDVWNQSATAP